MASNPESTDCLGFPSLRRRSNLTPCSKVYKASPKSLFWTPNGLPEITELPEMRFEFAFNLIGFFYRANHGAYSNPGTQVEA